jgi:uncharacterized membrane protein (DUF373 family)
MKDPRHGTDLPETRGTIADAIYITLIRILAGLLIIVLCAWMLLGCIDMIRTLGMAFGGSWAAAAEHTIIDALIMLALLEVIRTLQAYLKLGRVRVTFILDTALVVLIGELMGLWFREYAPEKVLLGLGVIVTLVVLRLVTARFSPEVVAVGSEPETRPVTLQTPATAMDDGGAEREAVSD